MKKSLLWIVVLVLSISMIAAFSFAGCKKEAKEEVVAEEEEETVEEKAEEEPVVVTIGHDGTITVMDYMEKVLEGAKTALPNIEIKQITYPTYDDLLNMIPSQIAAGTVPDILWWDAVAAPEYIRQGVVEPLDEWLSPEFKVEDYLQVLLKAFTYEGKLYGIPLHANDSALVVNLDLFQEAGIEELPSSVEEFRQAAIKVKDTGNVGVVVQLNAFHIGQYVIAHGGGWNYGETINSEANKQGIQFLVDLFTKDKAAVTSKELGSAWDGEAFAKGDVGMSTGGPWYIGFMSASAPQINYKLIPFPGINPGETTMYTYGAGYSIMKGAEHKAEAVEVLEYLSSDEAQELLYTTELKYVPAKERMIDNFIETIPEFAPLKEAFFNGVDLAYPIDQKGFSDDLTSGVEQLIYNPGTGTVEELLDTLQQKYGSN